MSDFFNEVDEDVRATDARTILRKLLPWIIGAVVLIVIAVGGYWGWSAWRAHTAAEASEAYDRGMKAMANNDLSGADTAFAEAAKVGPKVYKSAALAQRAGILVQQNKTDAAVKMLDDAADAAPDVIQGDQDRLKAIWLVFDKAPYAEIEKRAKPLMEKDRPYRSYAREALAMAKMVAGKTQDARGDFLLLSVASDVGDDVHRRAQAAMSLIDAGQTAQLVAIAKAAAALPPPPAGPAGGFSPFAQPGDPAAQGAPEQ